MLVLSRRTGEQLTIGPNIRVTVLAIRGNRVHLGITAPAEAAIVRTELMPGPHPADDREKLRVFGSSMGMGRQRPVRNRPRVCRPRACPEEESQTEERLRESPAQNRS